MFRFSTKNYKNVWSLISTPPFFSSRSSQLRDIVSISQHQEGGLILLPTGWCQEETHSGVVVQCVCQYLSISVSLSFSHSASKYNYLIIWKSLLWKILLYSRLWVMSLSAQSLWQRRLLRYIPSHISTMNLDYTYIICWN